MAGAIESTENHLTKWREGATTTGASAQHKNGGPELQFSSVNKIVVLFEIFTRLA